MTHNIRVQFSLVIVSAVTFSTLSSYGDEGSPKIGIFWNEKTFVVAGQLKKEIERITWK